MDALDTNCKYFCLLYINKWQIQKILKFDSLADSKGSCKTSRNEKQKVTPVKLILDLTTNYPQNLLGRRIEIRMRKNKHNKSQRDKNIKTKRLLGHRRRYNVHFNLRRERIGAEAILDKIVTENFAQLMKYTNPKIKKTIKS